MSQPTDLEVLRRIGLEERELVADPQQVPVELRRALPPTAREFIAGGIPRGGFGIGGKPGVGKTCAMVAFLRLHLQNHREKAKGEINRESKDVRDVISWVDWPSLAHELRTYAVTDPDWVRGTISRMSKAPVLILDDLGAERRKGDYQDDYAAGELDYIVTSSRYRACLPTLYTTNLSASELANFYGSRFSSRLLSESPLVVMAGEDRRKN